MRLECLLVVLEVELGRQLDCFVIERMDYFGVGLS